MGWDDQGLLYIRQYNVDHLCNSWISALIKYLIAIYILMIPWHVSYVKDTDTPTEQLQGQEHIQQNKYFITCNCDV